MEKRVLSVSYCIYRNDKVVPIIRILGVWLQKAGFNVFDKVEIYQNKPDELILKKVSNASK